MDGPPLLIPILFNSTKFANVLVDTGCDAYGATSERFAQSAGLDIIRLPKAKVLGTAKGFEKDFRITHMARAKIDVDGWESAAIFYVIPGLAHDAILGLPWMRHKEVIIDTTRRQLEIGQAEGLIVKSTDQRLPLQDCREILGSTFAALARKQQRRPQKGVSLYATSIRELTLVINILSPRAPRATADRSCLSRLPEEIREFGDLFEEFVREHPPGMVKQGERIVTTLLGNKVCGERS
jgi:predicted aspartyl protease